MQQASKRDRVALSVTEAAELLGVSRPTVYQLLRREDFPSFRIGARRLISRSGLEEWVRAQTGAVKRSVSTGEASWGNQLAEHGEAGMCV